MSPFTCTASCEGTLSYPSCSQLELRLEWHSPSTPLSCECSYHWACLTPHLSRTPPSFLGGWCQIQRFRWQPAVVLCSAGTLLQSHTGTPCLRVASSVYTRADGGLLCALVICIYVAAATTQHTSREASIYEHVLCYVHGLYTHRAGEPSTLLMCTHIYAHIWGSC